MNTCDTWEFNSAKAKALRLKAEAHRWDARVCELLGDAQGALDNRTVAEALDSSARGYDNWAREAPDAPVARPVTVMGLRDSVAHWDERRLALVPVLDAPPATLADADEDAYVIDALAKLLAEIAIVVNGPEPPLTRWSYHDLPEKVRALKQAPPAAVPAEPFGMLDSQGIAHEGNSSNFAWLLEKHRAGKPEWGNRRLLYLAPPSEGSSSADFIAGYCEGRRAAYDAVVNAMRSAPGAKEALAAALAANKENGNG